MTEQDDLVTRLLDTASRFERLRHPKYGPRATHGKYTLEASARLMQGWYALSRFRQLERSDPDDFTVEWSGPQFEHLRFHAEAFYYFAFRFRCIVRRVEIVYGGQVVRPFNGFECPGIRFSRNHLIEHSDKTDGVIADNFASGIPEGLVIQPFTTDVRAPLDRGLYPNALEFVTKIDERLSNIGLANKVDE